MPLRRFEQRDRVEAALVEDRTQRQQYFLEQRLVSAAHRANQDARDADPLGVVRSRRPGVHADAAAVHEPEDRVLGARRVRVQTAVRGDGRAWDRCGQRLRPGAAGVGRLGAESIDIVRRREGDVREIRDDERRDALVVGEDRAHLRFGGAKGWKRHPGPSVVARSRWPLLSERSSCSCQRLTWWVVTS